MKHKAFLCGILCAAVDFWLIPSYFARGVPDYIWMTLMVVLPVLPAVLLLRKYPPKTVLWSALTQILLVMVFANPIGRILGYQLGDIANDLFDYIGYLLFCLGWIAAATAGQFVALLIYQKMKKS